MLSLSREKIRRICRKIGGFSLSPVVVAIMSFVAVPVVSFVFPADEYGRINLFYSSGMLAASFLTLGLENSLMRFYWEPPKGLTEKSLLRISLLVSIGATLIVGILVVSVGGKHLSQFLFGDDDVAPILLLLVYTLCSVIMKTLNVDARMKDEYARYNVQFISQNLVSRLAFVVVSAFSVYYFYSIAFMTAAMAVITVAFLLIQFPKCAISESAFELRHAMPLLAFGLPVMAAGLILQANAMVGKLALTGHALFSDVGVFSIATTLSNVFAVIPSAFAIFWGPFVYRHYKDRKEQITVVHDMVMASSLYIVIVIMLCQNLLFMLVGDEYKACQSYFLLIMLNPIQSFICETTSYGIAIAKKPIQNAVISGVSLLVNVLITCLLMPSLGVFGAAAGVAASSVLMGFARSVAGQRFYRCVSEPWRSLVSSTLILGLCVVNGFIFGNYFLVLAVCFTAGIATTLLYRTPFIKVVGYARKGAERGDQQ